MDDEHSVAGSELEQALVHLLFSSWGICLLSVNQGEGCARGRDLAAHPLSLLHFALYYLLET